ncbi:MAG: thiamine phosphate synthase [Methylomonas sp.]|jgi:thiamine-phosphate pyrophosphorylase
MKFPRHGLYVITQSAARMRPDLPAAVEAALKGGAKVVQYRDKTSTGKLSAAKQLLALCRAYQVPLLINDDVELALAVAADGVHLGKEDGDILAARRRLGETAIIGVSCYNDVNKALAMQSRGADYVAFGRFFPSNSKPQAPPADIATLQTAKQILTIPIVAIGGILPENGEILLAAGADVLAVIGGVFDSADPETAALAYQSLFAPTKGRD